tara:strand:+ start:934 stop:1980 length:1047 start_codon:yes stop_codon:yes gene_type:complete
MKLYKLISIIIIIFLKTGNVLSENNIFDVNNIEIELQGKVSQQTSSNKAIREGFNRLTDRILLEEDNKKLSDLKFSEIKELVNYYQVEDKLDVKSNNEKINYKISFDKEKIHNLFFKKGISYSEIINKELYLLPILKKNEQVFIFNQNYLYDNWNRIYENELVEFVLPLENIEIIQNVNSNKNNLIDLDLRGLLEEYSGKNLALIIIEYGSANEEKIYLKSKIQGKNIVKKLIIKNTDLSEEKFFEKIIIEVKKELINLIKSQNLIDIRTPSFLNANLQINDSSNLEELKVRLKKIDLIEKIYVQEFNNEKIFLKIKYLGKLDKIIGQLEENNILLKFKKEQWSIKLL